MLITREADYALRILRTLSEGGLVTAAEITQRELIPRQFAYKILRKLSRVGIIAVNRGVEGGCRLTADLREKSLYDLMAALDLVELVNACMAPGLSMLLAAKLRQRLQNPQPAGGNPAVAGPGAGAGTVLRRSFPVGEGGVGRYFFFQSG